MKTNCSAFHSVVCYRQIKGREVLRMKSKWYFISSVFQIVVGLLAIVSFIVMAINGDLETRWVVTLILAIAFVVMGVLGVLDNRR